MARSGVCRELEQEGCMFEGIECLVHATRIVYVQYTVESYWTCEPGHQFIGTIIRADIRIVAFWFIDQLLHYTSSSQYKGRWVPYRQREESKGGVGVGPVNEKDAKSADDIINKQKEDR
jgi:hypothetical protein